MSKLGPHRLQLQGISRPRGHLTGLPFNYSQHYRRSSRNRNPQSAYWRNMTEEKTVLEREKSRLRMQASRARKKERERLLTERKKQNETFQQYSSWQTSGEGRDTKRCILYIIFFLNSNQTTIGAYKRCIHVLIKVNWAVHLYINLRDNPPPSSIKLIIEWTQTVLWKCDSLLWVRTNLSVSGARKVKRKVVVFVQVLIQSSLVLVITLTSCAWCF